MRKIFKEENIEKNPNLSETSHNPTANIPQKELEKFCDMYDIKYNKNKYSLYDMDILLMLENICEKLSCTFAISGGKFVSLNSTLILSNSSSIILSSISPDSTLVSIALRSLG